MKKMNQIFRTGIVTSMFLFACKIVAIAQETSSSTSSTVTVENSTEPSSWIQENWMWLVGAGVVILIIALLASSSSRNKTTTVTQDGGGNVRRVSTTEIDS